MRKINQKKRKKLKKVLTFGCRFGILIERLLSGVEKSGKNSVDKLKNEKKVEKLEK